MDETKSVTKSAMGELRDAPWVSEECSPEASDLVRRRFALVDGGAR